MKAWLVSSLDIEVYVKYASDFISIPPKARVLVEDKRLLGEIPSGILVLDFKK